MSDALTQRVGYSFQQPDLLLEALTHPSYVAENADAHADNQRLEFLGDAVLQIVVTDLLYDRYPDLPEGQLTKLRAILTRRPALAAFAQSIDLGLCLRLGNGEQRNGGADRPSTLCDAFEALLGAMYLDAGNDVTAVAELVHQLIDEAYPNLLSVLIIDNPKGTLQELVQKQLHVKPEYRLLDETGPDHEKQFTVGVVIGGKCLGEGIGSKRQAAEQAAAASVLQALDRGEVSLQG